MNNGALHDKMIANIMKTPIAFFESTSPGVIMNRFSKDMGQIDDMMPACFSDAMSIALQSLIILALSVYANYFSILLSGLCSQNRQRVEFPGTKIFGTIKCCGNSNTS